ncbi:MAG: LacI family DNA-binding transcriptional regulator [Pseudomonadota bacterium]
MSTQKRSPSALGGVRSTRAKRRRRAAGTFNINDIAEKAGVAPATVSRALNGYADIADATRERILKLAEEHNYRPSARARQLARGRVETVAFVLPATTRHKADPFLSDFLDALASALSAHDYDLLVATVADGEPETEVFRRLVAARKCAGFVLTNSRDDDPRITLLQEMKVPFVVYGRANVADDYAHLDMDNAAGLAGMVDHLAALGHQRFAYLDLSEQATFARLRRQGFDAGIARNSVAQDQVAYVSVPHTSAGGQTAVARLFDGGDSHRPTAVVCPADVVAIGAIQALSARGYQVGRDVSVTGYDGVPLGAFTAPPLTTMSQPTAEIGHRLIEILFKVMNGADPATFNAILKPTLVRRESDGSPTLVGAARSHG